MAYCDKCGAYIPDGQTKCLACGFDEKAQAQTEKKHAGHGSAAATASAPGFDGQKIKSRLEEQREKSRRWAQEEQERRRQREEETRRREAEARANDSQGTNTGFEDQGAGAFRQSTAFHGIPTPEERSASKNRLLAAASYFSVLFILPILLCPKDNFARFHARQGLVLFIFSVISDIIGSIIPFGWILTVFRIYCIVKGVSGALSGEAEPLPYIGKFGIF